MKIDQLEAEDLIRIFLKYPQLLDDDAFLIAKMLLDYKKVVQNEN